MNQRLSDIWKFITYDIWRITESEVTRTKFSIYNIIKTIYLCVNRFNKDRIVNKASALTYSTLLAIVPILAIVFAIARGFGVSTLMESQFRDGFGGAHRGDGYYPAIRRLVSVTDQKRYFYRSRPGHVAVGPYSTWSVTLKSPSTASGR